MSYAARGMPGPARSTAMRCPHSLRSRNPYLLLLLVANALSHGVLAWQYSIPASSFSHAVGSAVPGTEAWIVTPSATRDFAIYGAYITSAPTNTQICAHFYMAIDDVTSDNLGVASLDLFNSGSYLNHYYLLRSEFSAANVTQVFRVCGTTPSSGINLEARVYSVGTSEDCCCDWCE